MVDNTLKFLPNFLAYLYSFHVKVRRNECSWSDALEHIGNLETRLWSSTDVLRSTSIFASNEYFMPVMGLNFLRNACLKYLKAGERIYASAQ